MRAFEEVAAALDMFDTLPVPVLEALRDHVADQAKEQSARVRSSCARLRPTWKGR